MTELYEQLEEIGFIVVQALIALTITRIVLSVLRALTRPNFIPEEQKIDNEKKNINIDKDLKKYFDYKE